MKKVALFFATLMAYVGLAFAAVNINSATKEQLESLDGIGPVKAQAIVDYRAKNGPFKSLDDVKKVTGVGDATFDKIKKDISLTGTTVPAKADKSEKVEKKVEAAKDKTVEKASEAKAAVKEKAADTKAAVKEKASDAKAATKEAVADTKAAAKKTGEKIEAKATAAKETVKDKAEKVEKKVEDKKAVHDKKEADEKKKKEDAQKK
jgi:competence protein ComEA